MLRCRGQSILEYVVLIAVVAAAFVAMYTYARRAVQANFRQIEHSLLSEALPDKKK